MNDRGVCRTVPATPGLLKIGGVSNSLLSHLRSHGYNQLTTLINLTSKDPSNLRKVKEKFTIKFSSFFNVPFSLFLPRYYGNFPPRSCVPSVMEVLQNIKYVEST